MVSVNRGRHNLQGPMKAMVWYDKDTCQHPLCLLVSRLSCSFPLNVESSVVFFVDFASDNVEWLNQHLGNYEAFGRVLRIEVEVGSLAEVYDDAVRPRSWFAGRHPETLIHSVGQSGTMGLCERFAI